MLRNLGKKEKYRVEYGDIPTGRGLLLPLFEYEDLVASGMDTTDSDVWSKTGKIVLIPKTISYKNIYNDEVTTEEIRKMNESPITISMYVAGRG